MAGDHGETSAGTALGTANGLAQNGANPLAGTGHVAAVDLGGTKILAAIVGPDGTIVSREKLETGSDHAVGAVADRIAECVRGACSTAGIESAQLAAVGIGAPGPIDLAAGVVKVAPNLGWRDAPLRDELERRVDVPVALDNDVRIAVIAEHAVGVGRGVRNMIGVWPGTGVGGGLILNGQIYTGSNDVAGEVGHMTLKIGGPKCGCGGRGHLESLASRTAIVRDIVRAVSKGEKTILTKIVGKDLSKTTSGALAKAWAKDDPLVTRVLERAAKYLAVGIASLANALNPELVVLGGGVIEGLGESYVKRVRSHVHKLPLPPNNAELKIVRSGLGDDAGVTGAALLARRLAALPQDQRRQVMGVAGDGASASA